MRSATHDKSAFRWKWLGTLVAAWAAMNPAPADALVVQDMTGTTVAPADDPGWNYVTGHGSRNYVYLGNGWALSAFHVGLPDLESDPSDNPEDPDSNDEQIAFPNGSFIRIKSQAYQVKNPCFYTPAGCALSGTTEGTDLRLIRLDGILEQPNGQPLPNLNIASQEFTGPTPLNPSEVTFIGPGPTRWSAETQWAAAVVPGTNPNGSGNDTWTESCGGEGQPVCNQTGYKSFLPDDDVKRWGTNQIADEDALFGGSDTNLRGTIRLNNRDIVSMVTKFDAPGAGSTALVNETQTVAGDSGSAVFHKRNGNWELIGIVNAVFPPLSYDRAPSTAAAVYGSYTTFADLSYYRDEILRIMNDHPYDLVMGDVNLDGVVGGNGTGSVASDDVSAFVAGWLYDDESGTGSYASWLKGDLSGDGKTDIADFFLLRSALNSSGSGAGLSLDSLVGNGVPEPASALLAIAGAAALAGCRSRRRRRAAD